MKGIQQASPLDQTSCLEGFHSVLNHFAPKMISEKYIADVAPYGKMKRIRSDNGGEFISYQFKSLLRKHAIKHETSAPYSPHQNGTVERAWPWRSLFSMARCLLLEAKLPRHLWTYAVMASVYIQNRCFNPR